MSIPRALQAIFSSKTFVVHVERKNAAYPPRPGATKYYHIWIVKSLQEEKSLCDNINFQSPCTDWVLCSQSSGVAFSTPSAFRTSSSHKGDMISNSFLQMLMVAAFCACPPLRFLRPFLFLSKPSGDRADRKESEFRSVGKRPVRQDMSLAGLK